MATYYLIDVFVEIVVRVLVLMYLSKVQLGHVLHIS